MNCEIRRALPGDAEAIALAHVDSPMGTPGIIVLRLHDQTPGPVGHAATVLAARLLREPLPGGLWVLDEHRLRIWPGDGGPV